MCTIYMLMIRTWEEIFYGRTDARKKFTDYFKWRWCVFLHNWRDRVQTSFVFSSLRILTESYMTFKESLKKNHLNKFLLTSSELHPVCLDSLEYPCADVCVSLFLHDSDFALFASRGISCDLILLEFRQRGKQVFSRWSSSSMSFLKYIMLEESKSICNRVGTLLYDSFEKR